MSHRNLISVIIPHMNQPDYLAVGLRSLNNQLGCKSDIEIIVVDNGSKVLPAEVCGQWPNVRLLSETVPGPGPARNRGASEARGDLLCFIDADCRADEHWLAAIEDAFRDSDTQIIGGDVRVRYERPGNPMVHEPYEAIYSYRNDMHIAEGFSGTGNLAMRPAVLAAVGPFGGINIAEDRDWGLRANAMGFAIRYVAPMIVYHPARPNFTDLTVKWDRHICHDYTAVTGLAGKVRWLAKAAALAISPVVEIPTVLRSPRVSGWRERWLAFACLVRIRFYRAWRMLAVLFGGDGRKHSDTWNRR